MPNMKAQVVTGHLQNVSIAFKNSDYVMNEVFPKIPVGRNVSKITVYNKGDMFRDDVKERARGSYSDRSDQNYAQETFTTKQYDRLAAITEEDLEDAGIGGVATPPVNMKQDAIEQNADKHDLHSEIALSSLITDTAWADGAAGGEDAAGLWASSETTNNTFRADIKTGLGTLREGGVPLNHIRLLLDYDTFMDVKRIDTIIAQTQYTSGDSITAEMLAKILEIEKVVVSKAIYNSANKAKDGTDFTSANIYGGSKGKALLYYYPPKPGLKTIAAGYHINRKIKNQARLTETWYEPNPRAWNYRTLEEWGTKAIATAAAYAWKDTITT